MHDPFMKNWHIDQEPMVIGSLQASVQICKRTPAFQSTAHRR